LKVLKGANLPIVSIDIPSGWDVERGNETGEGLEPEMLISLTFPKECALYFKGPHHFLGGRFIPPMLASKYGLDIPTFPGTDQCLRM
jgi:NAD(P)H-hydrate repair Nnr-like enzyme with NAD(P)H-hydrate epimerase domain